MKRENVKRERTRRFTSSRLHVSRRGFTLIELVVVMGIIVLIAAVSVPAFKFITGSRSVDSGANVVNAMIGRARTAAVTTQTNYGVFFFVDPRNDRTTLALVHQTNADAEYLGWSQTVSAGQLVDGQGNISAANSATWYFDSGTNPDIDQSSSLINVVTGQEVVPGTANVSRCAPIVFQCTSTHQAPGKEVQQVPQYFNGNWNANSGGLDIARDTEFQLLPPGVGAEVVIDPQVSARLSLTAGTQRLGINRYVRTGCILFDSQGRFATLSYDVYNTSKLGQALMLDQLQNLPQSNRSLSVGQEVNNPIPLYSGFGVVLFDRQAFLADAKINGYTEGDWLYGDAGNPNTSLHLPPPPYGLELAPQQVNLQPSGIASTPLAPEFLKEQWLDANGTLFTATRYNGALTKSE